jgi:zona occludens toxin (predicted ATPase)
MAHTPLKMSIEQTQTEVSHAWANSYSPAGIASAVNSISDQPVGNRVSILIARLCFRGIYFPQMGRWAWAKVIVQNRQTIYNLAKEGMVARRLRRKNQKVRVSPSPAV